MMSCLLLNYENLILNQKCYIINSLYSLEIGFIIGKLICIFYKLLIF